MYIQNWELLNRGYRDQKFPTLYILWFPTLYILWSLLCTYYGADSSLLCTYYGAEVPYSVHIMVRMHTFSYEEIAALQETHEASILCCKIKIMQFHYKFQIK